MNSTTSQRLSAITISSVQKLAFLLPLLLLFACEQDTKTTTETKCYQLEAGTHLPRLFAHEEGVSMSFVTSEGNLSTLNYHPRISTIDAFPAHSMRSDSTWFVNWADFPSSRYFKDKKGHTGQFSHWLQYSADGTYDYDIYAATEHYQQESPFKLHQDTVAAEHGFLSSATLPSGGLQVTWLDGRYTKQNQGAGAGAEDDHGHGHGGGAMTLRTKALSDSASVELDHRVCDCCNTATVATDSLIIVAYRDRSEHEIRDISYVTKPTNGNEWSTPKTVHADNWEINGCPVNGPALAANDAGNIAVVWYTAPRDRAQINFARYHPTQGNFTTPITLDDQIPLGRVDLQIAADGTAYATGLTTKEGTDDAFLTLWTIAPNGTVAREDLTTTSAARSSGFPKIALFQDKLYWTRTVVGAEKGQQFVEVCWR